MTGGAYLRSSRMRSNVAYWHFSVLGKCPTWLTLTGTNDYQGNTTISGGTLGVSSDANLGAATGILNVRGGGTLQFLANLPSDRNVTIGPGNAIFDTNGHDATLGGAIPGGSSTPEFHKIGTGTLTLGGGEQHLYRASPDYCRD